MHGTFLYSVLSIALIGIPPLVGAMSGSQAPTSGQIAGVVLNAETGKPIAGVRVGIDRPVATDAEGHFVVNGVQGRVQVTFSADGYLNKRLMFSLESAQQLRDVTVRLSRGGSITGRVFTSKGQPAVGTLVTPLYHHTTKYGVPELVAINGEGPSVNDRGEFRLVGLPAGKYLINISDVGNFPNAGPPPPIKAAVPQVKVARPILYPGIADVTRANFLDVGEGQTLETPTVTLSETRFGAIRVRMVNPQGTTAKNVQPNIELVATSSARVSGAIPPAIQLDSGASAEVTYWPNRPGHFNVLTTWRDDVGNVTLLNAVSFTGADVDVPVSVVRPDGSLTLQVREEQQGGSLIPVAKATLLLERPQISIAETGVSFIARGFLADEPKWALVAETGDDGRATINHLSSEVLHILGIRGVPQDSYVLSIRQGERGVLTGGIATGVGAPVVDVRIRKGSGTLRGVVRGRDRRPLHDAMVVLVPAGEWSGSRSENLRPGTRTAQDGSFEIRGIAPGPYYAIGWSPGEYPSSSVPDEKHLDPTFMADYLGRRQNIAIVEKGAQTLDFTVE